tara:strand:+ start:931 stop:2427 length:1497 start_codon:yes stop_codon:yes gene_type:complete
MKLLIVGHLEGYISQAGQIAIKRGAKVVHCETQEQAIIALRGGDGIELVMIDVKQDVKQFIEQLKAERMAVPVIACGIGNDKQSVVRAIKSGAKEYVPLPPDPELIAAVLQAVTQEERGMIAEDPVMQPVVQMAKQIAPSDATVLITGESGTGKEVMAKYIHDNSPRKDGRFVSVNCAAIPENLLESELFGHEKGAFTGAVARRIGKFEEANGGTLLLDEVTEMPPLLQAKLLRAIQEREIDRLGGNNSVKVDIRIIATSNRDLQQAVMAGQFREDLYFRLNVVNIMLPPLRDRKKDMITLANFFVNKFSDQNSIALKPLSQAAVEKLQSHIWRGNIRELENTMHRAVLISTGEEIGPESIILSGQAPAGISSMGATTQQQPQPQQPQGQVIGNSAPAGLGIPNQPAPSQPQQPQQSEQAAQPNEQANDDDGAGTKGLVGKTVADVERDLIIDTLEHCLGNRTHAANILGISIRTLRNKLRQYTDEGMDVPKPGNAAS